MATLNLPSYARARQNARSNYAGIAAMQDYARMQAQQRGARQIYNIGQKYEALTPRTISAYSQRGLAGPGVTSGLFSRGLQNLASAEATDRYTAQLSLADQLQNIQSKQDAAYRKMQDRLEDIDRQKAADQARIAASLRSFKPFLGS